MSKAWRGVAAFEATASEVRELEVQSQATKSSKKKGKLQAKKRKKQVPSLAFSAWSTPRCSPQVYS
jgi:hypothetical protein